MIKHFHNQADCSAYEVDFASLNLAANFYEATGKGAPVIYLGNYYDDDNHDIYALFGIEHNRVCIKI